MPDDRSPSAAAVAPIHRGRLLVVLLVPLFMALVSISVINVALTPIGESLGASSTQLQWVLSGYALGFAVPLVPAGRLGDATGRRRMVIIGLLLFTLGSLLAGAAQDPTMLNLARIVQGLGSGLLNPQTIGLIQRHFHGQDRAKAFAALGTAVALATAIGPVTGGLLIHALGPEWGWRWMFLINVPLGVASIVLSLRWIPQDRVRTGRRLDLDPVGTVLLSVSVLLMMLPFLERGATGWVWLALPIGLVGVLVWWRWERRVKERGRAPMVDPALLRDPVFRNGSAIVAVYFLGATSIWIILPLYLQMHLAHSALEASIIGLPSSMAAGFSSQIAGRHVLRLGRRMVIIGLAVLMVGIGASFGMAGLVESGAMPFWGLAVPLTLIGASQGMTIGPNQTLTLQGVDPAFGGVAGGVMSLGQRLGTAVGTALIPGMLFSITEAGGDWLAALHLCGLVIIVLMAVALLISVADRVRERRAGV